MFVSIFAMDDKSFYLMNYLLPLESDPKTLQELNNESLDQTAKTAPITRVAVRETGVSRHHGGSIVGPREIQRTSHTAFVLRGLRWVLWASIMPRDAGLSDSQCKIFPVESKL